MELKDTKQDHLDLGYEVPQSGVSIMQFEEGIQKMTNQKSGKTTLRLPLIIDKAVEGPKENEGKERITIRIDADVLAWFRAQVKGGGNYQTLINDTLRAAMNADDAPLTVRKLRDVLRQELRSRR